MRWSWEPRSSSLWGLVWHHQGTGFPRGVPLIQGVLALLGMAGMRAAIRLRDAQLAHHEATGVEDGPRRVLLVGAGSAGTRIGREIQRHPDTGMELVGYLDDDRAKAGLRIAGAQVVGGLEDLPSVVTSTGADEVLITMPSASGITTRRVRGARHAGRRRLPNPPWGHAGPLRRGQRQPHPPRGGRGPPAPRARRAGAPRRRRVLRDRAAR